VLKDSRAATRGERYFAGLQHRNLHLQRRDLATMRLDQLRHDYAHRTSKAVSLTVEVEDW